MSMASSVVSQHKCHSLHGSLQHATFIFQEGRSTLHPLSSFISKFHNEFTLRHAQNAMFECILWWKAVLSAPGGSHSLMPCCTSNPDIWVDTSSSWGISLVIKKSWSAWRLLPSWDQEDRDIGWAESVALELAVLWLARQGFADCDVMVRGDNTGVIGVFNKGCFRMPH